MTNQTLSEQEMIGYLSQLFPSADLSTLGKVGLNEAVRVARAINELGLLLAVDFALIVSYALAFERWIEASQKVKRVQESDNIYISLANGSVQTHPALINEQKYFSIMRASIRHILSEIDSRTEDPDDEEKKDELEQYLEAKGKTKDG
jgi:phage terminase small subunit